MRSFSNPRYHGMDYYRSFTSRHGWSRATSQGPGAFGNPLDCPHNCLPTKLGQCARNWCRNCEASNHLTGLLVICNKYWISAPRNWNRRGYQSLRRFRIFCARTALARLSNHLKRWNFSLAWERSRHLGRIRVEMALKWRDRYEPEIRTMLAIFVVNNGKYVYTRSFVSPLLIFHSKYYRLTYLTVVPQFWSCLWFLPQLSHKVSLASSGGSLPSVILRYGKPAEARGDREDLIAKSSCITIRNTRYIGT